MSSLSIRNMNHSKRYQDELEGRAAPMTKLDRYYSLTDAIQGAVNMAKWAKGKNDMKKFWSYIHVAYRLDAQLVAFLDEQAEDTRSMIDF